MKIQIASNAVVAKLLNADEAVKVELVQLMSYAIAGAEHSSGFASGGWSGRSTLFSYEKSTFPAGLLSLVVTFLTQAGHKVQVIRKPAPAPKGLKDAAVNEFARDPDYDYQYDTVEALVRHRQIIAQIATGGGKSNIASIALARLQLPTLFVTTRSVLMYQMKRTFEKSLRWRSQNGEPHLANVKVGIMGDSQFAPTKTVCVAMVQTLQARLNDKNPAVRKRMAEILALYNLVIAEEAHESSGNGYYEVLGRCTEAHYRLALTATPFMKDDEEANMKLMACSGPVGIRVTEKELIDKGILATPIFKYVTVPQASEVGRASNWQRSYHYGIVHNAARNDAIARDAVRAAKHGLSTMILIQRKEHGKLLHDLIAQSSVNVRYIFGESDQDARDAALADLASGKLDVLIGSTILDVGVDVPSVGMVINGGAGKAEVALRQRIGRGLRKKKASLKNVAYMVDYQDQRSKHLVRHAAQRRAIVESTPGFNENILKPGVDFDFSHLRYKGQ